MGRLLSKLGSLRATGQLTAFVPVGGFSTLIRQIIVSNTSGVSADVTIYHAEDGSTHDESTALIWQKTIAAGETWINNDLMLASITASAEIYLTISSSNKLTVTAYGTIFDSISKYRLLGQKRPGDTSTPTDSSDTDHLLYTIPLSGLSVIAKTLVVCNTTVSDATFRLFHCKDDSGEVIAKNALFWDYNVSAGETAILEINACGNFDADDSTNFLVQQGTASALTFTLYGMEL